jgi:hypothetical protein
MTVHPIITVRNIRPIELGVSRRGMIQWKEYQIVAISWMAKYIPALSTQYNNGIPTGIKMIFGDNPWHAKSTRCLWKSVATVYPSWAIIATG